MCDFFSGIMTKDGRILTDSSDSHSIIREKNGLKDDKPVDQLDFYPFEIRPLKTIYNKPTKENRRIIQRGRCRQSQRRPFTQPDNRLIFYHLELELRDLQRIAIVSKLEILENDIRHATESGRIADSDICLIARIGLLVS